MLLEHRMELRKRGKRNGQWGATHRVKTIILATTLNTIPESRTHELMVVSSVERRDRTARLAISQTNQLSTVHEASSTGTMRAMLDWPVLEQQRLSLLLNVARLPMTVGRVAVQ
jgi:hypothetical protein